VQAALQQSRAVLKGRGPGAGGGGGTHLWLRMALISRDKSAAMLFDDLTQVRAWVAGALACLLACTFEWQVGGVGGS